MAEPEVTESTHQFANVWAVHAERDGQPWLRDWATSEADANKKLAEHKANDDEADKTEYWVMQMSVAELESFQHAGVIPQDL
jgi:hypothetical protein